MKPNFKNILNLLFGLEHINYLNNLRLLIINFLNDFRLFYKYSTLFKFDSFEKIECQIILDYHSIEKGFLFSEIKPRFGKVQIERLHSNIIICNKVNMLKISQVEVCIKILCQYYEVHKSLSVDISDYFSNEQYEYYKEILGDSHSTSFSGSVKYLAEDFYKKNKSDFYSFSSSRKSVRHFTGKKIDPLFIKNAISLALNAPSVCNRQGAKVYLLEDKLIIDKVLKIQGGMKGYTTNVSQLLILTENRNYFYTVGERNQLYIDGGIFLMNLLYSLHYYKIANCPANWGKNSKDEKKLAKIIKLPNSEKIICMLPIGIPVESFNVTLSKRRCIDEVFKVIDTEYTNYE